MQTVHCRVNDAATSRPTPVRIRFIAPDGSTPAPFGRLSFFATTPDTHVGGHLQLGNQQFFFLDGTCEIRLPAGMITIEASKGPEYSLLRQRVQLAPGKIALRLSIDRWSDLRAERWFSGDTRATSLSPHAALLEAAAEDVAVVNLLAWERPAVGDRPPALPNLFAFSGTAPAVQTSGHIVAVNTLNVHPVLGTVALLNSHRVVYPLRFGDPDGADDWSVLDWCEQCHRKKGLVVWPDLPRLTAETPQGEALAALLLGQIDAFEVSRFGNPEPTVLGDWYRLLDCGLRLPLVGGSGKNSNSTPLGLVRTYARLKLGEEFSYAAWIEAVRAGRTFVTNGPLLLMTVNDQDPGAVLSGMDLEKPVRVRLEVRSRVPIDQLELLVNGRIQASKTASGNRLSATLETELNFSESAWIAARCWGREPLPDDLNQCVYAHTSPVYAQIEGKPIRPDRETIAPLLEILQQMEEWTKLKARCELEKQRAHLLGVIESARQLLLSRVQ